MNRPAKMLFAAGLLMGSSLLLAQTQPQSIPVSGPATKLSSIEYFPPPNETKVKVRMDGAEMTPLPDANFAVKQLQIQRFSESGSLEAVVKAPECVYDQFDGVANSSGHLELDFKDNKIHVEGDGFLWRQSDDSLDISNNVTTVIKSGAWKLFNP